MQMENWMNFEQELEKKTAYCESVIRKFLPDGRGSETGKFAATVIEAMNYSVLAGGKRLRPLFISETCAMYGGRKELAEPFMAAIEMIHTYSLVHDDLPAMDNDEYRRGRKTTHAVYGEGMAVLAGDGLLNGAFETALKVFRTVQSTSEETAAILALEILVRNSGIYGMIGGQCADLEAENHPEKVGHEMLMYIHRNKTARMIQSGFQIGAVLAGAPQNDIEKLGQIAENIGIAFQIQDDILDVIGDSGELGKKTGSDAKDGKVTYVTMNGLDKSAEDVRRLSETALVSFDTLHADNPFLRTLIQKLITRTR